MDGQLGPKELWTLERAGQQPAAPVPPFLSWLHPGGRSTATPLAILLALFLGALAGRIIDGRLRVYSCTHCGGRSAGVASPGRQGGHTAEAAPHRSPRGPPEITADWSCGA